jgi:hypothetical protein
MKTKMKLINMCNVGILCIGLLSVFATGELMGMQDFIEFGDNGLSLQTTDIGQETAIPVLPARRPKVVKYGLGPNSKLNMPDQWDNYNYAFYSLAYSRLKVLGLHCTAIDLFKLCKIISELHIARSLTKMNRATKRRLPCAYHWLDENWAVISSQFDAAAHEVIGHGDVGRPQRVEFPHLNKSVIFSGII